MADRITATLTATEVTVYIYRTAGICGPDVTFEVEEGTTLPQLDALLDERGYSRVGDWTTARSYEGLWLEAALTAN